MTAVPNENDVLKMLDSLSNWGRWGADDQLGTVNFITPAERKRAAALVSEGVSVSCSRPISTDITADTTVQPMRFMVDSGRSCNLVTSREGAQVEAVDLLRDGVVTRGVLLDVAALKGRWLEAGEGVMPED